MPPITTNPALFNDWRSLIQASVSPLDGGARGLQVVRLRSVHQEGQRPGRTAAVLVPITDSEQPHVLLTRRARHLRNHGGQISFPGGAADDDDQTGVETALREAEEEIGLPRDAVEPIGFLDRVDTISDFRVLPVVGIVRHAGPLVLDEREVDEVFSVPLTHLMSPEHYRQRPFEREGKTHLVYSIQWKDYTIWGITAAILADLARRGAAVRGSP